MGGPDAGTAGVAAVNEPDRDQGEGVVHLVARGGLEDREEVGGEAVAHEMGAESAGGDGYQCRDGAPANESVAGRRVGGRQCSGGGGDGGGGGASTLGDGHPHRVVSVIDVHDGARDRRGERTREERGCIPDLKG